MDTPLLVIDGVGVEVIRQPNARGDLEALGCALEVPHFCADRAFASATGRQFAEDVCACPFEQQPE
jgi:hypothetical protein